MPLWFIDLLIDSLIWLFVSAPGSSQCSYSGNYWHWSSSIQPFRSSVFSAAFRWGFCHCIYLTNSVPICNYDCNFVAVFLCFVVHCSLSVLSSLSLNCKAIYFIFVYFPTNICSFIHSKFMTRASCWSQWPVATSLGCSLVWQLHTEDSHASPRCRQYIVLDVCCVVDYLLPFSMRHSSLVSFPQQ